MRQAFLVMMLILWVASLTTAQTTHIEEAVLVQFEKQAKVDCILYLKDRVAFDKDIKTYTKPEKANIVYQSLVEKSSESQKQILAYLQNRKIPYQSFYITNAIRVKIDRSNFEWLAQRPEIEWIFYNQPIQLIPDIMDKNPIVSRQSEPEWGLKMIQADSVWTLGFRGEGVLVGGQDTGYAWDVSPLKQKYKGYADSLNIQHDFHWHDAIHEANPVFPDTIINPCGYNLTEPCDDNNHGTHTMGTMVGEDDENQIGVAPDAKWIGCRNMERGWGSPASYLECFEWFLAPYDLNGENADPNKAPHVINNSWYCSAEEGCNLSNFYLLEDAVTNLRTSGVVVVVSAGNSGRNGCSTINAPPAIFKNSFTIGATTQADSIADFSSRGMVTIDSSFRLKPDVSAPGAGVRSVIRNGGFANFSGTSMAGPHAAGLVALIISANPQLSGQVDEIEEIIRSTAVSKTYHQDCNDQSGNVVPNPIYGYGRINALAAVEKALLFSSTVEPTESKVIIYPNPAHDEIHFLWQKKDMVEIHIYNIQGQKLLSLETQGSERKSVSLHNYKNGTYFAQFVDMKGKSSFQPFIKQ